MGNGVTTNNENSPLISILDFRYWFLNTPPPKKNFRQNCYKIPKWQIFHVITQVFVNHLYCELSTVFLAVYQALWGNTPEALFWAAYKIE